MKARVKCIACDASWVQEVSLDKRVRCRGCKRRLVIDMIGVGPAVAATRPARSLDAANGVGDERRDQVSTSDDIPREPHRPTPYFGKAHIRAKCFIGG